MIPDVLESFNQPSKPKPAPAPSAQTTTRAESNTAEKPGTSGSKLETSASNEAEGGEDFEASLVEGMESLLRQLAGDNPPGPMPGTTSTGSSAGNQGGDRIGGSAAGKGLSADDEEKAFQRAIEMMLSKEGIDALGLEDDEDGFPTIPPSQVKSEPTPSSSSSKSKSASNSNPNSSRPDPASFEETIRKAMESLNSAGDKKPGSGPGGDGLGGMGGIPSDPAELAKLLAQLGNDPNLDLEGDDELSGILDGMMGQLMTREVLEEPMSELASKVSQLHITLPFALNPHSTSQLQIQRYRSQFLVPTSFS